MNIKTVCIMILVTHGVWHEAAQGAQSAPIILVSQIEVLELSSAVLTELKKQFVQKYITKQFPICARKFRNGESVEVVLKEYDCTGRTVYILGKDGLQKIDVHTKLDDTILANPCLYVLAKSK